jgi:predicted RNA-binding Zn ribbon-like protein
LLEKDGSLKPFQMIAGQPALDFVNTIDNPFAATPTELLTGYDNLLRFVLQAELITERQCRELKKHAVGREERSEVLAEALHLRESLATLLYALLENEEPGESILLDLEAIFKTTADHRQLVFRSKTSTKSSLELGWEYKDVARDIHSPVWLIAQAANDLLTSPQPLQINRCLNPTCQWLFLDTSKNHTRRWCDMKVCGNRQKARRFNLRRAAG